MESRLRPLSPDAFYSLGSVLLQLGQPGAAAEELAHADRLKPNSPAILLALGRAASAAKDTSRAEASWTRLLGIDKQSAVAASAHFELAALYRRTGRPQDSDREMAEYEKLKNLQGQ